MGGRITVAVLCLLTLLAAQASGEDAPAGGGTGVVAGVVLNKASGEPIIDAGVEVIGQGKSARTDLDGRYMVRVPPGTYEVRIFAGGYQAARLQNVVVVVGRTAKVDVSLAPAGQAGIDVVEVVAQADRAAEATQLLQRKNSAVVSETVSAETIKKSPDSDAAEVVQRVPAVTVRDDKFVFVRGLGERYSSALLNGSRLPSTDPEKRVVPLDLFPADFIESLAIVKSYTPDLPGDFSGGLVDIHLREFPERLTLNLGVAGGGNTQVTFKDFDTYDGGSGDYFGLGKGARALPGDVPDTDKFKKLSADRMAAVGRSFKNIWDVETDTAPPNTGFNLSVGDSFGPLGLEFGGIYTTEYKKHTEVDRQFFNANFTGNDNGGAPDIQRRDAFTFDDSTFETRLGGVFTAAYKPSPNHKLTLRTLVDQNSFDQVFTGNGPIEQLGPQSNQQETRLRYTQEQLAFGQLAGEHHWDRFWIDWRTAYSRTTQDIPDTRYITYVTNTPDEPLRFTNDSLGGTRFFSTLDEKLSDSAVDFTVPFYTRLPFTDVWSGLPAKFKFGPAYAYRDRDFSQRRFQYVVPPAAFDLSLPPEELLAPDNLGPGGVTFDENTQPRDLFSATQEIAGAYGMFDLPLVRDRLRFVAGVRMEYSYIVTKSFDDLGNPTKTIKNNLDPLPGANLILSPRDDMNVRLSYSQSVSRPEFRELSPTQFPAQRGLRPVVGNPDLVESNITNWDFRWEWFFSPSELVSLGAFQKTIDKPIEATVIQEASNIADSFTNADTADLEGFEFEGRKNFGFISPHLQYLSLLANVAYIQSTVTIPRAKTLQVQTSTERPLQGQAPYVVNAALDYTHPRWGTIRLLYNTAGSRVFLSGSFGLPDILEEPRNELDAVAILPLEPLFGVPLTAKLALENLLDDQVLYTQGGRVQRAFESGVKMSVGLSYSY